MDPSWAIPPIPPLLNVNGERKEPWVHFSMQNKPSNNHRPQTTKQSFMRLISPKPLKKKPNSDAGAVTEVLS